MKAGRYLATLALTTTVALAMAAPAAGGAGPLARSSVVGGTPASLAEWGFTVSVLADGKLLCSGSVIGSTRVLTAAHCIPPDATRLTVVANATRVGAGGELIGVVGAVVHPDWATTQQHDLAVLSLASPTTAPAIALPTPSEDAATTGLGASLEVAGFGRQNPLIFGKGRSGALMETRVRVRRGCQRYKKFFVAQSMICALGTSIKKSVVRRGVCNGDSGGPLVAATPAGLRVVGVSSFVGGVRKGKFAGILCGFDKAPNVFARVSDGLTFVQAALAAP